MTKKTKARAGKKRSLGRGFEEIFVKETGGAGAVEIVPAGKLQPGRFQPRRDMAEEELEELASSIRQYGILQPLLVRPLEDGSGNYEIIAGERRWRAAQMGQRYDIPVYIRSLDGQEAYVAALAENLQRENLNPIEEALAFQKLRDEYGLTQEKLADIIGKTRSYVTNILRLLTLPDTILSKLRDGTLSSGHGRALLGASDPLKVMDEILEGGLTVRQTEARIRKEGMRDTSSGKRKSNSGKVASLTRGNLGDYLARKCGVQTSWDGSDDAGILNIRYKDSRQLEKLLSLFKK